MIRKLANTMARGASLIVTDRRWGATLSAAALGFGLFAGVAIGPGATGTFATGPQQLLEIPSFGGGGEGASEVESTASAESPAESAPLASSEESSSLESFASAAPLASESSEALPTEEEPAAEAKTPPAEEEEEVEPETTALAGTVVHANPAAGSYTLAIKGGELVPVHTRKLPRVGTELSLGGLQLANGTFAEQGTPKRKGQATKASFRGVVTHLDPDPAAPAYTLSGRGASIFVHVRPDPSGVIPPLPTLGAYATASVDIEKAQPVPIPATTAPVAEPPLDPAGPPTCVPDPVLAPPAPPTAVLWQRELKPEGTEPATYLDLSGIVTAVCPDTAQLLLSADDTRESDAHITLAVPPNLDLSKLKLGDSLLATANLAADGTLTLAGLASDEQRKGADDPKSAQGDLKR